MLQRNILIPVVFGVAATLLLFLGLTAAARPKQYKVVIQYSARDSLSAVGLNRNLKNLTEGWPEARLAVVFHGPGLDLLVASKTRYAQEMASYKAKGVELIACENTMATRKIARDEILPVASFVKMGIKEIVYRQADGWYYIKGGL